MRWKWTTAACALGAGLTLAGCGVDLGACDPALLDGVEGQQPHAAQRLVFTKCASCHSENATGAIRNGAPADLDFDVLALGASVDEAAKVLRGGAVVREWREEMWDQIDSGDMPPAGFGSLSADEKETVRNWLACGSPVVAVPENPGAVTADWASIYGLFEVQCLMCHATGAAEAGDGFEIGTEGDACGALNNLVNAPASTDACMGRGNLVVPGDPDASLLLDKLGAPVPRCGARMPFGFDPLEPDAIDAIRTWIQNGAQAPADCGP